jgi:hypothetical protein
MEINQTCDWCNQQREVYNHKNKLICEPCYQLNSYDLFFFKAVRNNLSKKSNYEKIEELATV